MDDHLRGSDPFPRWVVTNKFFLNKGTIMYTGFDFAICAQHSDINHQPSLLVNLFFIGTKKTNSKMLYNFILNRLTYTVSCTDPIVYLILNRKRFGVKVDDLSTRTRTRA